MSETHHITTNSRMISFRWREKVDLMSVNHRTCVKFIILRKNLKSSYLDEVKRYMRCYQMIRDWWNSSLWEQFYNDSISMKKRSISDVGQWWNIGEIHHDERNSKMISCWWRGKVHWMLVNHETLVKFIMVREILEWWNLDEEQKYIGC